MKITRTRLFVPSSIMLVLFLVSIACGTSTADKLASALPPTQASQQKEEDTPTQESLNPSKEIKPTNTVKPTKIPSTSTPKPEPIKLISQGFGQKGQELGYSFIVENPNSGLALENSQYQIAIYDAGGTVIMAESGYIELILPGQKLGIGGTAYLNEGLEASKIDVQIIAGNAKATDLTTTFTTDKVTYYSSDIFSKARGIIVNPFDKDLSELRISAVIYNEAGEIIGGGYTYLNFLLAQSSTGVEMTVTSAGQVAKVELYPAVSGLSMLTEGVKPPENAQDLVLIKQGYGQDDTEVGFGMLIQNPNGGYAVERTMYHVTFYAEDGSVLGVNDGYVDTLLPDQVLGIGGDLYLEKGVSVARADFQIMSGDYESSDSIPTFTSDNVKYLTDRYFPKVTGEIVSPYAKDITNLRVSVIAYNEAGDIIGGGYTYLDFVPANGKAAVEVSIKCAGKPAKVELYASVSSLSEFK